MGHSGGQNTNGATSASPPPPHSPSSDGSAPPVAPLLSVPETLLGGGHETTAVTGTTAHGVDDGRHVRLREATMDDLISVAGTTDGMANAETPAMTTDMASDSPDEIFYVQLDPDSQLVTGVLPEMEQLHVQLTQLRRVLRQSGAVLCALRDRARAAGDDPCELHASLSSLPSPQTRRCKSEGRRPGASQRSIQRNSVHDSARVAPAAVKAADRTRPSPRSAPHRRSGSVLSYSLVGPTQMRPRRHGDGENDDESEWCDAATVNTSSSTTTQSTPSPHPTLLPPPPFQLFEEDEVDDEGRGSQRSSVTGVRRTLVARFRPDSVPSSIQSTPSMQPASVSYARSDGGGVLCLPPSTSSVARSDPAPSAQRQPSARQPLSSPIVASPSGSIVSRLENSPLLPPSATSARLFDQRDATSAGRLDDAEKAELMRLSQQVADLYRRRGLLLQKADRVLCQHAQQHERWEGNEERRGCYRCRRLFSRLTRRHHCRRCGRLCCAECSRYVGKKQDTSYVAPVNPTRGSGAAVAHRVIIKSEYTARMTADDPHVLAEESFDEHTYPRRGASAAAAVEAESPTAALDEDAVPCSGTAFAASATTLENGTGRSRQHKWVRLCAPCYQNCLRARRNNALQYLKNANLCILDDGYYYYHVMTKDELCQLSTALSKPDSFKKQVELMSHVVMERSVDYASAAPAYSAQTLATAMQHTPDVLRTLGGISAYAFRSARQTANDYVGGYFTASRTILPDHPIGAAAAAAAALSSQSAEQDGLGSERRNNGDEECSEASVESLDDTCSETQSPSSPGTDDGEEDEQPKTTAFTETVCRGETTKAREEKSA
ncbi:FYVE zinc finger containing protein [Lotmaria passim]